jgi:hypothetical protein
MFWAAWALCNAVLYGVITQANRYWQLPGAVLARWRALIPALFMLPFIFFVPVPGDPMFYLASIASGLMVLPHDGRWRCASVRSFCRSCSVCGWWCGLPSSPR